MIVVDATAAPVPMLIPRNDELESKASCHMTASYFSEAPSSHSVRTVDGAVNDVKSLISYFT